MAGRGLRPGALVSVVAGGPTLRCPQPLELLDLSKLVAVWAQGGDLILQLRGQGQKVTLKVRGIPQGGTGRCCGHVGGLGAQGGRGTRLVPGRAEAGLGGTQGWGVGGQRGLGTGFEGAGGNRGMGGGTTSRAGGHGGQDLRGQRGQDLGTGGTWGHWGLDLGV